MELEVDPGVNGRELLAIRRALDSAGRLAAESPTARSAWRRAAVREAVAEAPAIRRYAPSPRSTRGATRA